MKTMLMSIGILFLISSCNCLKIKPDIRRAWSPQFKQCRCQWYSFSEVKATSPLVPCEKFFDPIIRQHEQECQENIELAQLNPEYCFKLSNEQYCEGLVGFSPYSWATNLTPHGRESKRCYEDTCGDKKSKE